MEVRFGLLNIYKLTFFRGTKRYKHRQRLRHTHTNVGNINTVSRSRWREVRESTYMQFDLHGI